MIGRTKKSSVLYNPPYDIVNFGLVIDTQNLLHVKLQLNLPWKLIIPFMNNEIILYQPDSSISLEVRVEDETVWLTQAQMTELFASSKSNISEHLRNIFETEELIREATVRKFRTVRKEGDRLVSRNLEYFNLDVIISLGFRVNTSRGIQFRQWANGVLKGYMMHGYAVNQRFERLEYRMTQTENKIDFLIRTNLPPSEGIFFNGQIWDAYSLVNDLIRSAKRRVIVIDNYADDSVLNQLDKRNDGVEAAVYTFSRNRQIRQDVDRHNQQYPPIQLHFYNKAHDRFLITDNVVYHIGASLKDLGKKLFAFSRMESLTGDELLAMIN